MAKKKRNKSSGSPELESRSVAANPLDWVAPLSIFMAAALVYCNSLNNTFVFDDRPAIQENTSIRSLWPPWSVMFSPFHATRPVVGLSLAVNYAISGLDPWSYHAFNILVHSLAAAMLYFVMRLILERVVPAWKPARARAVAWAAALLWAVHPLQTQAVDYVIQRSEAMMGLFFLVTLYCIARGIENGLTARESQRWQIAAVIACALSMGCKQVAAAAPILALLYDRTFASGSFVEALRRRPFLYVGLFASYVLVPVGLMYAVKNETTGLSLSEISAWQYFRTQPGVIAHYLWLSIWPANLCFDYAWPIADRWLDIAPFALVLGSLFGATLWALAFAKSDVVRAWGFLGAWFFFILAPTSSVMPIRDVAFEQRMYLPLAAALLAAVAGLNWLCDKARNRIVFGVATAALAAALGAATLWRNTVYASVASVWEDTIRKRPENVRAYDSWGLGLMDEHRYDDAIPVLREFVRKRPELSKAHVDLACALDHSERQHGPLKSNAPDGEAEQEYRECLRIEPQQETALFGLAARYQDRGDLARAHEMYDTLLKYHPDSFDGRYNLAALFYSEKRYAESSAELDKALELRPASSWAWGNRAAARIELGQLAEARDDLLQAVKFDPKNAIAYFNLGRVHTLQKRNGEAIAALEMALKIQPDFQPAQKLLQALRENPGP